MAWTDHLAPVGPVEVYLVERAVRLSWQLDRADRCQVARLDQAWGSGAAESTDRPDRLAFDDSPAGERLRRYQLACGRMLLRTLDAFNWIHSDAAESGGEGIAAEMRGLRDPAENAHAEPEAIVAAPASGSGEAKRGIRPRVAR